MEKEEIIITPANQAYLDDFLKYENKECLDCLECVAKKCTCITSEFYNMDIADFGFTFCINKITKKDDEDYEGSLFEELY